MSRSDGPLPSHVTVATSNGTHEEQLVSVGPFRIVTARSTRNGLVRTHWNRDGAPIAAGRGRILHANRLTPHGIVSEKVDNGSTPQ